MFEDDNCIPQQEVPAPNAAIAPEDEIVVDLNEEIREEEATIHDAQPEHSAAHPLTIFQTQVLNMSVSAVGVPEVKMKLEYILGSVLLAMTIIAVVLPLIWLSFLPFSTPLMAISLLWITSTVQLYGITIIIQKFKVQSQEKNLEKLKILLFRFHALTFLSFNLCMTLINTFSYAMNSAFYRRELRWAADSASYCYDGRAERCLANMREEVYNFTQNVALVPWFIIILAVTAPLLIIHWLYVHKNEYFNWFYIHLVLYSSLNLFVYLGWALPVYFRVYFDYTPWFLFIFFPTSVLMLVHFIFYKMKTGFTFTICGVTLSATTSQ